MYKRQDLTQAWVRQVKFDDRGLVPTVVQDAGSGQVLMLAYSNAESLGRALYEGRGWYWSRSRKKLWRKGATSGNSQELVSARWDCDGDTVLFQVRQTGPACHTGVATCFGPAAKPVLPALERTLQQRQADPERKSYTQKLLDDPELLAAKLREETLEVIEAVDRPHVTWECADLLYHLMVRMTRDGITLDQVQQELHSRF